MNLNDLKPLFDQVAACGGHLTLFAHRTPDATAQLRAWAAERGVTLEERDTPADADRPRFRVLYYSGPTALITVSAIEGL